MRLPIRLRRRFRFAGLDVETSALEVGLEKVCPWDKYGYGKSISYTTRKLTKNMSPKKGGPFFQKEVNHLDLFSWIFRGNSDIRAFSGIC